jgi:hypothetical protein
MEEANKSMTDIASELSKLSETFSFLVQDKVPFSHSLCEITSSMEENQCKKSK